MLSRAKNLAHAHVFDGGTDEVNKELDHYLAVKREDLQRVAKTYFLTDKTHILHYPPAVEKSGAAK
jgi:predicted Zn-dependent peptidase